MKLIDSSWWLLGNTLERVVVGAGNHVTAYEHLEYIYVVRPETTRLVTLLRGEIFDLCKGFCT